MKYKEKRNLQTKKKQDNQVERSDRNVEKIENTEIKENQDRKQENYSAPDLENAKTCSKTALENFDRTFFSSSNN